MTAVVFYFQVHQPYRIARRAEDDDARRGPDELFDQDENRRILERVAERCYLPMNAVLERCIDETGGAFRCAFSISGTALAQLEAWAPEALASFQRLAETGNVEFLAETAGHSLASLVPDCDEFERQTCAQRDRVAELFGRRPTTFRNTECVLSNDIARRVEAMGFDTILGEGADHLLDGRTSGHVYGVHGCERVRLLLRNYLFSDDIAFRFSNREWESWPLMSETFAGWLHHLPADEHEVIGLFMDYETFGEHQWAETGILEFMEHVPAAILTDERFRFATPAEAAAELPVRAVLDVPEPVSWADEERDVSAWLGNPMQRDAHAALYALLPAVRRAADDGRPELLTAWRQLSTSDHVYYMCTKRRSDGDVHEYFTPHESPHDSYVLFARALAELRSELAAASSTQDSART